MDEFWFSLTLYLV